MPHLHPSPLPSPPYPLLFTPYPLQLIPSPRLDLPKPLCSYHSEDPIMQLIGFCGYDALNNDIQWLTKAWRVPWPPANSATPRKNKKIDMYCFVCPTQLSVMLMFSALDFCRLYKVYNKPVFRGIVYFCAWLLLCLAFFEDPAVPGMGLPYWVSHNIIKS